jgi:hypothetical protein
MSENPEYARHCAIAPLGVAFFHLSLDDMVRF